jgi:hypothetical protein
LAALTGGAGFAVAQGIPGDIDPGRVGDELQRQDLPRPTEVPPLSIPDFDQSRPAGVDEIRFVLRSVELSGNEVISEGDRSLRPMLLKSRAKKIQESRPLEASVLERYLLLTDDLPGMSARAILRPSNTTSGARSFSPMGV